METVKLITRWVVVVVALWVLSWILTVASVGTWPERAAFGDMFGAVNALFAGLAFAGIIVTVYLQKRELELQRDELAQTREEIRGQKEQMELQNRMLKHQQFENTFFQLLRLHNEIVGSMHVFAGVAPITQALHGRDCFAGLWDLEYLVNYASEENRNRSAGAMHLIEVSYEKFFERYQADLGHYFRTLYNAVKFVDNAKIENPKLYTNLIRAQLSSNELLLIFYNCLSHYGRDKFKPLIERYSLLKGIPEGKLLHESHKGLYAKEAFG